MKVSSESRNHHSPGAFSSRERQSSRCSSSPMKDPLLHLLLLLHGLPYPIGRAREALVKEPHNKYSRHGSLRSVFLVVFLPRVPPGVVASPPRRLGIREGITANPPHVPSSQPPPPVFTRIEASLPHPSSPGVYRKGNYFQRYGERERERDPFTSLAAVTVFSDFPLQARSSPPHAVQRSVGMRSTRGPE